MLPRAIHVCRASACMIRTLLYIYIYKDMAAWAENFIRFVLHVVRFAGVVVSFFSLSIRTLRIIFVVFLFFIIQRQNEIDILCGGCHFAIKWDSR